MKLLVVSCLLAMLVGEGLALGYHEDVGIPEAARIMQKEARQMTARIVGGMPSQYGDNPHLAGLLIMLTTGQMSVCSGTLLSSKKVLTAGQCWYDGYSQGRTVVLGSLQLFYGSRFDVSAVSVHPGFDPRKFINDLAMLTLRWEVSLSLYDHVKPALLPLDEVNTTFAGVSARVSGYGKTSDFSTVGPNTAQHAVSVPVINDNWSQCYYLLPQRPSSYDNLICTRGDNGWGTCGGDLGGPLVVDNYYNFTNSNNGSALLIGVTSIQSPFGCQTGFATGYVRVTSYLSWILRNM